MSKQKVVIYGLKLRKLFKYRSRSGFRHDPELYEDLEFINDIKAWEGEIDNPPLEIGEKLYISDFDETVEIVDRARNSDGGYVYWTRYVVETIEDEKTDESKKRAESEKEKYLAYLKKRFEDRANNQDVIHEEKKWYQLWK